MIPFQIDPQDVACSFNHAAKSYDQVAELQRKIGLELSKQLENLTETPNTILDMGSGTGFFSNLLKKKFSASQICSVDIAYDMLAHGKFEHKLENNFVCGNVYHLPFADHSVDLIFSNLMFQWCLDLKKAFAECRRVLKPNGVLLFTTFGPNTLSELKNSWACVDQYSHVNHFLDLSHISEDLKTTGFSQANLAKKNMTLHYPDVFKLMRQLKKLGAHNMTAGRFRGLTGKKHFLKLTEAYEHFRDAQNNLLPASYEVYYGEVIKR